MNPTVRKILIITLKNAVNALIVNGGAWIGDPHTFNFTSGAGWIHVLRLAAWVVVAREGTVWIPKLLAWSQQP
jgi:hypothetical protein